MKYGNTFIRTTHSRWQTSTRVQPLSRGSTEILNQNPRAQRNSEQLNRSPHTWINYSSAVFQTGLPLQINSELENQETSSPGILYPLTIQVWLSVRIRHPAWFALSQVRKRWHHAHFHCCGISWQTNTGGWYLGQHCISLKNLGKNYTTIHNVFRRTVLQCT